MSQIKSTASVKLQMALDDEICSSAVGLQNSVVNGVLRSKFAVPLFNFCGKSFISFVKNQNQIFMYYRALGSWIFNACPNTVLFSL